MNKHTSATQDLEIVNRAVIEQMVEAFSTQDLDRIMKLFGDDAVYYDVQGLKQKGNRYQGKTAIREFNKYLFERLPPHHYEDAIILVNGNQAHANWTLVVDCPWSAAPIRISGGDYFELENGKVTLKNAWLQSKALLRLAVVMYMFTPSVLRAREQVSHY